MCSSETMVEKLKNWNHILNIHSLPAWEEIPSLGLYMDQVMTLLSQYLCFLAKEGGEPIVTASAINNYVRIKIMPPPRKKKYDRIHIAYLIMICSLKQGLSISDIQKIIPYDLTEDGIQAIYNDFSCQYVRSEKFFIKMIENEIGTLLDSAEDSASGLDNLVFSGAVIANLSKQLTSKLLELKDDIEPKPESTDKTAKTKG